MKRNQKMMMVVGLLFLILGCIWRPIFVPEVLDYIKSKESIGDKVNDDVPMMEGNFGMMRLLQDLIEDGGNSTFDFFNLSKDDFELDWDNVFVTSEGIINADTGELIFQTEFMFSLDDFFPLFGVEKRDYKVWTLWTKDTVPAVYTNESEIRGKKVYVYSVNITNYEVNLSTLRSEFGMSEDIFGNDSDDSGMSITSFLTESSILYDEYTLYHLDPKTSIPLYMDTEIIFSFIFPDMRKLQVYEDEQIRTSEGEVWVENDTIPGKYDKIEVIEEEHSKGEVLREDENIALFDEWTVYYYKDSGEPLPEENQGEHKMFAVDRTTFKYISGYGNQNRSGYYTFPIGNVEKIDYPMWDEVTDEPNNAVFVREEEHLGVLTYIFEMYTEEAVMEGGHMLLPIYRHPGTVYIYDGLMRWYVEKKSGMFVDIYVNGTYSIASGGPLNVVKQTVATFEFSLEENITEMLLKIAFLFSNVLLPLSNQKIRLAAIQLHFTDEMIDKMFEACDILGLILEVLRLWIPLILIVVGFVIVGIPVLNKKRKKEVILKN